MAMGGAAAGVPFTPSQSSPSNLGEVDGSAGRALRPITLVQSNSGFAKGHVKRPHLPLAEATEQLAFERVDPEAVNLRINPFMDDDGEQVN